MGDERPTWKPSQNSTHTSSDSPRLSAAKLALASRCARILFGCYGRNDANDPDVYVTAAAAVLSHFPEDLIIEATSPDQGMQVLQFKKFPPNVGEIRSYCDALLLSPRYRARTEALAGFQGKTYKGTPVQDLRWNGHPLTSRQIEQLLDREAFENEERDPSKPTYEQLQAKYGKTFGLGVTATETPEQTSARWAKQAPSWEQVKEFYEANPDRWQRLVKPREPGLR